jgi:hypothetical protein
MPFERNVFINCPFDAEYAKLLRANIFTILYLGYTPQISQTNSSGEIRISQIKKLIRNSKFGIHDISRCRIRSQDDSPRFNMPFELGLDLGAFEYGTKGLKKKKTLILEREKYHYQRVISDIAGQDIEAHEDEPKKLVQKVRNWFSTINPDKLFPPYSEIWFAFNQFTEELFTILQTDGYSELEIDEMVIADYIKLAKPWITEFIQTKMNRRVR